MSSRMDRYNTKAINDGRHTKNKKLYEQIDTLGEYSNIEAVASIENANEIDITKVKELLKSREDYKKQKKYRQFLNVPEESSVEEKIEKPIEEKNYDINDILSKSKVDRKESLDKYRALTEKQFNILRELNLKSPNIDEDDSDMTENDLFASLRSNTMIGDVSSIKKILDEEKNSTSYEKTDIDKSFYTSSLGFKESDFEELKDMNDNLKRNNILIKIFLTVITLIIAALIIYILFFK